MSSWVKKILPHVIAFALFALPFQTALIIHPSEIGTYGAVSLMALDIMLLVVSVLGIMCYGRVMRPTTAAVVLIFFIGYTFLSAVWSQDPIVSLLAVARMSGVIAFCTLIAATRDKHTYYMTIIAISAALQSGLALWQFSIQEVMPSSWLGISYHSAQQLGDSVVEVFDQRWLRAYGTMPHPNILAAFLVNGLFMCCALAKQAYSKKQALFIIACWSTIIAGLFVTFSREGWIGAIVGFIVLGMMWARKRKLASISSHQEKGRFGIPIVMVFAACIVIVVLSFAYWEPLQGRLGLAGWQRLEQRSMDERLNSYVVAATLIKERPIVGVGMYGAPRALERRDRIANIERPFYAYQAPHNLALVIVSELGGMGFVLFVITLIFFIHTFRVTQSNPVFVGLVSAVFTIALFDHFYWTTVVGMALWWLTFAFLSSPDSMER